MSKRIGTVRRQTNETDINVKVVLDGKGCCKVDTGIGFLDHMVTLFTSHGGFDIELLCKGDLDIDGHHTTEDVGIILGKCFSQALGQKYGIKRYGTVFVPMDESLSMVSLDISGRPYLHYEVPQLSPMVGKFDTQLVEEFLRGFCIHSGLTLHVRVLYGVNTHHMIEGIFKALGRALKAAVSIDADNPGIPSTKGILD
jgi:imidazoleglycerol-phosphate dehydratase